MDEHTLVLLDGVFNEVEDCLGSCVLVVEDNLVFQVQPLESQVDNASSFEVVHDLLARTINNVGDFIGDHKFLVLQIKAELKFEKDLLELQSCPR